MDVNATLDIATPHPERREVLFPGGVHKRFVRGAQRIAHGQPVGRYIPNPGFSPTADLRDDGAKIHARTTPKGDGDGTKGAHR